MSRLISAAEMAAVRTQAFDDLEARLERESRGHDLACFRLARRTLALAEAEPDATTATLRPFRQEVARLYGLLGGSPAAGGA